MMLYVLLLTGTCDLNRVYFAFTKISQWTPLEQALGLDYSTLQRIKRQKTGRVKECKVEMISAWLQQKDNAVKKAKLKRTRLLMNYRNPDILMWPYLLVFTFSLLPPKHFWLLLKWLIQCFLLPNGVLNCFLWVSWCNPLHSPLRCKYTLTGLVSISIFLTCNSLEFFLLIQARCICIWIPSCSVYPFTLFRSFHLTVS